MLEVLRGASVACQVVVPMYSLCLLQVNGKSNSLLVWSLEPCNLLCKVALEGGGNLVPSRRSGVNKQEGALREILIYRDPILRAHAVKHSQVPILVLLWVLGFGCVGQASKVSVFLDAT